MPKYTVTFDRIGRDRSAPPITVEAADANTLAEAVYRHVRGKMLSRDVDVNVDLEAGAGTILVGGRNGGRFTIAPAEDNAPAGTQPRVPIEQFGQDHWSTFAYVETRTVDHDGQLDHDRMRCHPGRHPVEFGAKRYGHTTGSGDGSAYPTRTKAGELPDHDDYDCLADLEAVGLLRRVSLDKCRLTAAGRAVAAELRVHKAAGHNWRSFAPALASASAGRP